MSLPAIDIVIPAIDKDIRTLPRVIDSVRAHVKHPIDRFLIVSPESARMRQLCARKGCTFVHEDTVLPVRKKDMHYDGARWSRSGWLYQQLLKLGASRLGRSPFYLTIDADTVLLRPHRFRTKDGRTIFYCRAWSQPEYFVTYRKLMGRRKTAPRSFVTHYMLFERSRVSELKRAIERRHGVAWYRGILNSMNRAKLFAFSEFETYGNFLYARSPGRMKLVSARNKSLRGGVGRLTEAARRALARRYRSVSFHERAAYAKSPASHR